MQLFLKILACVILIPVSLLYPIRFLDWLFLHVLEYKFVPFRWRECNYNLLLLPFIWIFPWLAFWIWWFVR